MGKLRLQKPRNIVASGAQPLAITDCLNYGSPDKPESFWELWTSADGIAAPPSARNTRDFRERLFTMKQMVKLFIQRQ